MYRTSRFFFYDEDKEYYLSLIKNDYKEAYQAYHTWYYTGKGDMGVDKLIDLNKMMVSYGERSVVDYLKDRIKKAASYDSLDYIGCYEDFDILWCLLTKMDDGKEMTDFLEKVTLIACRKFDIINIVVLGVAMVIL